MLNLINQITNQKITPISFGRKPITIGNLSGLKEDVFVKTAKTTSKTVQTKIADFEYKKRICKDIGLSCVSVDKLDSIVGPNELTKIVSKNNNNRAFYIPGEKPSGMEDVQDSYFLENVLNGEFGASFHNHTIHSDGKLTVVELLDQATEYADIRHSKTGKPFYLGITDHNTIEGCKEAVKIIAANPEKYKNLKVVLGSEITVKEEKINNVKLNKSRKLHILTLGLNPFDKDLNSFISFLTATVNKTKINYSHFINKNMYKNNPMRPKTISLEYLVDRLSNQKDLKFSFAHPDYPDIRKDISEEQDPYNAIEKIIHFFKKTTQNKGLYTESYYNAYFDDVALDKKMHQTIEDATNKTHLSKAGAIDTHGDNIFYTGINK